VSASSSATPAPGRVRCAADGSDSARQRIFLFAKRFPAAALGVVDIRPLGPSSELCRSARPRTTAGPASRHMARLPGLAAARAASATFGRAPREAWIEAFIAGRFHQGRERGDGIDPLHGDLGATISNSSGPVSSTSGSERPSARCAAAAGPAQAARTWWDNAPGTHTYNQRTRHEPLAHLRAGRGAGMHRHRRRALRGRVSSP